MPPFAIVDRDGEGIDAVLMILDDEAEAKTIMVELRKAGVKVDVAPAPPERRGQS